MGADRSGGRYKGMTSNRKNRHHGERGASVVEYALLIATIALIAAFAVNNLAKNASNSLDTASTGISSTVVPVTGGAGSGGGDGGAGGGGFDGGSSGGAGGGSSATTTAPAVTTTAAPAATTTAAAPVVTTTTAAPASGDGGWNATSATRSGGTWTTQATLTVRDNNGKPVANASVSLKIRFYERDQNNQAQWKEEVVQTRTGADGTIAISREYKAANGKGSVSKVEYNLEGAQLPNNLAWDQQRSSVAFTQPA